MFSDSNLIHIHKINNEISILTLVYIDYLDETQYLKIIINLFNNYYNKKILLLPFSINIISKIIIFYNIYQKFNFNKLNILLKESELLSKSTVSYISFNNKNADNLKPIVLPREFDNLVNKNIEIFNSYLKESEYKIFNLKDNGIIHG
jgi:hypothetical protein